MKLLVLLPSIVCLALTVGAQEATVAPTEVPETTISPEADSTSTSSPATNEPTTTVLPDSIASSTTEEPSTTTPSTTTAANEITNENSTDCKDTTPALCKSFGTLCHAPEHCNGKEGGSDDKNKEAGKKDKINRENLEKVIQPTAGEENDDDNDDAICAWVRMQTSPELREIAAYCDQKNIAVPLYFLKGGLIGGRPGPQPQPPKKPTDNKKQLNCRFREVASVSFRRLCPATCSVC